MKTNYLVILVVLAFFVICCFMYTLSHCGNDDNDKCEESFGSGRGGGGRGGGGRGGWNRGYGGFHGKGWANNNYFPYYYPYYNYGAYYPYNDYVPYYGQDPLRIEIPVNVDISKISNKDITPTPSPSSLF